MPPAKFKTGKRNRAKEALARLRARWEKDHPDEEWEAESEPVITPMLRNVEGGIGLVLDALRAHDDEDAQAFITAYDDCKTSDQKVIPLECFAFASGVGSLRLAEVAQTALFLYASAQTKLLISSAMHKVTKSIIKAATDEVPIVANVGGINVEVGRTNGDVKAMELFGKMSGIVPVPKGAQIAIQNNVTAPESQREDDGSGMRWKYPEDRLKEIVAVVSPKELPASTSKPDDQIHFEQNRPTVFERRHV